MTYPLTADSYKARVTGTGASDAAITAALATAAEAILDAVGPSGPFTERIRGGYQSVMLGRRATAITSVSEIVGITTTTLDGTDYEVSPGGTTLRRLSTGTHPSVCWQGSVQVVYTTAIGDSTREAVQMELAALDLGDSVGLASALTEESVGDWTEKYAAIPQSLDDRRASILARLSPPAMVFWVGSGRR